MKQFRRSWAASTCLDRDEPGRRRDLGQGRRGAYPVTSRRFGWGKGAALFLAALAIVVLWGAQGPLQAHDFTLTRAEVRLQSGSFQVDFVCDLDALALGVPQDMDSALLDRQLRNMPASELEERLEALRRLLSRRIRVRFDGQAVPFAVAFPEHPAPPAGQGQVPTFLGTLARLSGEVPQGAETFGFFASRSFPPVHLEFASNGGDPIRTLMLQRGERSPELAIAELAQAEPWHQTAWRYLGLGFYHIIPEGLDHILFVLGLFLLGPRLRPLIWQVTAFTAAHTATLALSIYGIVSLPSRPVEALIALSIAYVAIENIATPKLKPWRVAVVFAFGLLHGLGFAGVLTELGLPQGGYAAALISFNVGVELGQLAVLLGAFACVGWLRGKEWYRARIAIPLSAAIAGIGLFWFYERLFT